MGSRLLLTPPLSDFFVLIAVRLFQIIAKLSPSFSFSWTELALISIITTHPPGKVPNQTLIQL